MMGGLVLIVGVLFLLRDLTVWNFWNIQWWTAAFLIAGLGALGASCCKMCQSCCVGECCEEEKTALPPAKEAKKK
ncbi:MAG: hypothetical protein ABIH41_07345 [Nanoarchaeota archaeon]